MRYHRQWMSGLALLLLGLAPAICEAQQRIQVNQLGSVLEFIGTDKNDSVGMNASGSNFRFQLREGNSPYRYQTIPRKGIKLIRFFGGAGNDRFSPRNDMHERVPSSSIPRLELHGGIGDDELHGSYGNDSIFGGRDKDTLRGFSGHDHIDGGQGPDLVYGGLGDDVLCGGDGRDTVDGDKGNDVLFAGDTNNTDTLRPGPGQDLVYKTPCKITYRFVGNWTGDARSEVGFYIGPQAIFVRPGAPKLYLKFGPKYAAAISGDWNGDGVDEFGSYYKGVFSLRINGQAKEIEFGLPGDIPVSGDWDGDGKDEIGVFRDGTFYLDEYAPGWGPDSPAEWPGIQFGLPGDRPVIGDWDGDGKDDVGVFRNGVFYLDDGVRGWTGESSQELGIAFGLPSDRPVAGDWNGDGKSSPGVIRSGPRLFPDMGDLGWGPHSIEEVFGIPIP